VIKGDGREQRISILAPTGRDAELTHKVLTEARVDCRICANVQALCAEVRGGAGAILVSEEAIVANEPLRTLAQALAEQPQWSDLPVLVLTARGAIHPLRRAHWKHWETLRCWSVRNASARWSVP
jgi:hypothetical protein